MKLIAVIALLSLTCGGKMLIKYHIARTILSVGGRLPRDVIRFLDRATSLTIMSNSSGGYTFYHSIVRDYFTDKYESNYTSDNGNRTRTS